VHTIYLQPVYNEGLLIVHVVTPIEDVVAVKPGLQLVPFSVYVQPCGGVGSNDDAAVLSGAAVVGAAVVGGAVVAVVDEYAGLGRSKPGCL